MAVFDHLSNLLVTAERSSHKGAVAVDLFRSDNRNESSTALVPVFEDSEPIGRVVAEQGRICWVISKGGEVCLSDILALRTGVDRERFEAVFAEARRANVPFCEKLANLGLVDPEIARDVLRTQAAAALAELAQIAAQDEIQLSIATLNRVYYDERFTFSAFEMLQTAISQSAQLKSELGELPNTFDRVASKIQTAICFRESESSDIPLVPVSFSSRTEVSMDEALDLSLQAIAATQPGDMFAAEISPFALISSGDSETWVCSYDEPHLCVYQVDTQAQYLGVISSLLADRRDELTRKRALRDERLRSDG